MNRVLPYEISFFCITCKEYFLNLKSGTMEQCKIFGGLPSCDAILHPGGL